MFSVVRSSNVTLQDSNITGDGEHGVFLWDNANSSVLNCNISNNGDSSGEANIYINSEEDSTIDNNKVSFGYYNVYVYKSARLNVANNTIRNSSGNNIYIHSYCSNNTIYNNTITNSTTNAIYFEDDAHYNVVANNNLSKGATGIRLYGDYGSTSYNNFTSNVIEDFMSHGMYINTGNFYTLVQNRFLGNNITNCTTSVHLYGNTYANLSYNVFDGNRFNNGSYGVYLNEYGYGLSNHHNIFTNNKFTNFTIHAVHFANTEVYVNDFQGSNTQNGYNFYHYAYRTNLTVSGLDLNASNDATNLGLFTLINCNNITLSYSNLTEDRGYGVFLWGSDNTTIEKNNISSNPYGIHLSASNNSLIYNNYFDNAVNAKDDGDNEWNIPKTPGTNIVGGPWLGGNYWSDYAGNDTDGDGLGDTLLPYNSSGNIQDGGDYLPLIIEHKPAIGKIIWETNITIDMTESEIKNILTDVPADALKDVTGKLELITTLYSDTGQIIAHEDPFFYITDTNTSLTLETDKRVYKPNETINIYGEVKNHGSSADSYNLSIKKDGNEIFADAFTLNPDETHEFVTNTSSNTSFTLEGVVEDVTITDFVSVESPSINVSVIAPDVAGITPFNVAVLIENTGNISADLNISINSTWNITIPEGESRLLETTMSIKKNTTLNVAISGDVNQTIQKEIICGENARINITPQPTYLEGTVEIPFTIENTGILDSKFNATFSMDAQTVSENFFVPKGENITGSVSFNLTKGAHLLRYVSPFEAINVTINVLSPPEFVVSSIYPEDMNFTLGENVILVFDVENIGGTEGEATLRLEMPDFEDTNRTWVRPGTEENISFNLTIPDDLEEKNYKGIYELDGKRDEFRFFVQGAKISVEASRDKPLYEEGETAILTLNVDNERNMDLSLYSRVKFNEYDSVQNFTLPCFGSKTLTFNVPVNFTGDNKMLYTVYMDTGRSLYINSMYVYEKKPDVPMRLYTDKDVYNMGESVTIHIVDVTKTDVLNLTAPNFTYNDTLSGPTMLEFTLPELRSGTYYIEYTYGNFSSAHPFDVRGYSARIIEAGLDKEVYYNGDIIKLKMNIEANRNVSGLQKTWIYDPENELVDELAMNKTLMEGENKIEISRTLSTNISGIHVIVYGFSAELSGDSLTMLVSGAEYFDAEAVGLCGDVAPYPDCNGIVDMGDVILLLNNVSYPENPRYALCNAWAGDCRCNGVRDMGDVILLLNNVSYPEDPRYVLDCC